MGENYSLILAINFFGGLGLFLYGLMALSESLQRVAGKRMRYYLETSTKTTIRGVFSGAIFTALIQSSSATTVLVIGLLNAGLISLRQAATLIIGSNIGTVITGFIIGIKISNYSLIFVAIGMILRLSGNSKIRKEYGRAIFGFGILFFGINIMGESMYPLKESVYFNQLLVLLEKNSLVGLIVGAFLTALVQSSSAMVGILQEMFNQNILNLEQLIPILFGTAIGTTITAGFASINSGIAGKKAAAFHFILSIGGALIFMPLFLSGFYLFSAETMFNAVIGNWDALDAKMKIAALNAYFKIGYAIVFIPLIGYLVKIVDKLVKEKGEAGGIYVINLDTSLLQTPDLAYKNVFSEIIHMIRLAGYSISNANNILNSTKKTFPLLEEKAEKIEDVIDRLLEEIRDYTVSIQSSGKIEKDVSQNTFFIFDTIKNLERIGDYAQNIIKAINYKRSNSVFLPEVFYQQINSLSEIVLDSLEMAVKTMEEETGEYISKIKENNEEVIKIGQEFKIIEIRKYSFYENINLINYVVKNIIDNLVKAQLNINEIIDNYKMCILDKSVKEDNQ